MPEKMPKFKEWVDDNMTVEDLPNEDMRMVAGEFGVPTAVKLIRTFGGMGLSVPKTGLQKAAERYIKEYYGRIPLKRLVQETGVCERQIYYILNGKMLDAAQTSLLDMEHA